MVSPTEAQPWVGVLSSINTVSSPLDVRLEQYEGPLDLLLDLIRRQQIDIRDIPIAMITSQYLAYLDKARELDIDLGAEFVFMAATLIHIKSKMLLPSDPALAKPGEADDEDPRTELVNKLLEHERFKNAAEMLQQKRMIEENVWSNPQIKEFVADDEDPGLAISLFDLVKAFNEVLERAKIASDLRGGHRRGQRGGHGPPSAVAADAAEEGQAVVHHAGDREAAHQARP